MKVSDIGRWGLKTSFASTPVLGAMEPQVPKGVAAVIDDRNPGRGSGGGNEMRFVVLEHGHPHGTHWDILFEDPHRDALRTWSLPQWPPSAGWTSAEPKDPHRKLYLNYEGPLSGSRGWVRRREAGNYRLLWESADEFRVLLSGNRLKGILDFQELHSGVWQCRFQLALGA